MVKFISREGDFVSCSLSSEEFAVYGNTLRNLGLYDDTAYFDADSDAWFVCKPAWFFSYLIVNAGLLWLSPIVNEYVKLNICK